MQTWWSTSSVVFQERLPNGRENPCQYSERTGSRGGKRWANEERRATSEDRSHVCMTRTSMTGRDETRDRIAAHIVHLESRPLAIIFALHVFPLLPSSGRRVTFVVILRRPCCIALRTCAKSPSRRRRPSVEESSEESNTHQRRPLQQQTLLKRNVWGGGCGRERE